MSDCKIHKGEMNMLTFLPIDKNGKHILYGYRLCNNPECINPEHITTSIKLARNKGLRPKPLFHIRNDITGEELAKYARNHEIGKPRPTHCNVPHCVRPVRTLSLCNSHHLKYSRWRKATTQTVGRIKRMSLDPTPVLEALQPFIGVNDFRPKDRYCHVEGCTGDYMARGLCKKHYGRYMRAKKQGLVNGTNG